RSRRGCPSARWERHSPARGDGSSKRMRGWRQDMSHVDDGTLHAYLDGALDALSDAGELPDGMTGADVTSHLSTCADCRARLEAERAVRESAGAVLGDLPMPGQHVPDLPALDTTRPRRMRRVPLSWAAS